MPHEDALQTSLRCLYKEASKFRISIDIIVKLAKSLKLDTFVDTEETPGVQRLSIAGSLLLLEIDFAGDHTVSKVSLSSGNHTSETPMFGAPIAQNIVSESVQNAAGAKITGAKSVALSFSQHLTPSFLRIAKESSETGQNAVSEAEKILLQSLAGPTLGTFPENLKYLADIDRVSPTEGDLIVYMDNLATYLSAIHYTECQIYPEDWQTAHGLTSNFGKVLLNDESGKHVGVFLQFWQESRVLNHELGNENNDLYTALLAIEESDGPAVDYIAEATQKPWLLRDSSGIKTSYFFKGESDSAHLHGQQSVTTNANWKLVLRFTKPVFLPKTVLEYLGIKEYEAAETHPLIEYWQNACEDGEHRFKVGGKEVVFLFEESPQIVCLKAISLENLHILAELIPVIRNQLVFSKILASVALSRDREYYRGTGDEISRETKQKIRDSLQIPSDVPDEEILGLNTISSDYTGVQMLERDLELGSLSKCESEAGDSIQMRDEFEAGTAESDSPNLQISLQEMNYGSADLDYVMKISGSLGVGKTVDTQIRVQNGKLLADGEDISMDTDTDISGQFTRALALSEDLLLVLDAI